MKKGLELYLSVPASRLLNQTPDDAHEKIALSPFQMKSPAAVVQNDTADCVFLSLQNNIHSQTMHKAGSGESEAY